MDMEFIYFMDFVIILVLGMGVFLVFNELVDWVKVVGIVVFFIIIIMILVFVLV